LKCFSIQAFPEKALKSQAMSLLRTCERFEKLLAASGFSAGNLLHSSRQILRISQACVQHNDKGALKVSITMNGSMFHVSAVRSQNPINLMIFKPCNGAPRSAHKFVLFLHGAEQKIPR
jgi:hypothetical protein